MIFDSGQAERNVDFVVQGQYRQKSGTIYLIRSTSVCSCVKCQLEAEW